MSRHRGIPDLRGSRAMLKGFAALNAKVKKGKPGKKKLQKGMMMKGMPKHKMMMED